MNQEYSSISVSKETRRRLAVLKATLGYRTYDELINDLLRRAGYDLQIFNKAESGDKKTADVEAAERRTETPGPL
jgi:hypothetical protein